jgi:hypothetical protein
MNNTNLEAWYLDQTNLSLAQVIQGALSVIFSVAIAFRTFDWSGSVRKYKEKQAIKLKEKEKKQLEKFRNMLQAATGKEISIDIKEQDTLSSSGSETKKQESVLKIAHKKQKRPAPPNYNSRIGTSLGVDDHV